MHQLVVKRERARIYPVLPPSPVDTLMVHIVTWDWVVDPFLPIECPHGERGFAHDVFGETFYIVFGIERTSALALR